MTRVAIVDYKLCNLDSIGRATRLLGGDVLVTDRPEDLAGADRIILPGVGAFPAAMANLRKTGLDQAMRDRVAAGVPLLGICLGMQLLAATGREFEDCAGLGFIPGEVRRLESRLGLGSGPGSGLGPESGAERIPHIGWNEIEPVRTDCPLLAGVPAGSNFYFVHSFHVVTDADVVVARTPYCGGFASVVRRGNVFGTQFHPEKSQKLGFAVLSSFLAYTG